MYQSVNQQIGCIENYYAVLEVEYLFSNVRNEKYFIPSHLVCLLTFSLDMK